MSSSSGSSGRCSRRRFLNGFALYCGTGAVLANGRARASLDSGRLLADSGQRSLSFLHTHTGERLEAEYFYGGQYRPDCLAQVNHLLRDFRTGDVHPIDPGVLDILFSLQVLAHRKAVFQVISGYRSPATNAMLRRTTEGVAQHSMHLVGRAIDVRLGGFSTSRLAGLARSVGRGGVGFYRVSDFVHIDTGRVRFW
jgi:uncharacterized protein YcbK (DUF882 family)